MTADEMREMQWVKPELVAQIRFVEWTPSSSISRITSMVSYIHARIYQWTQSPLSQPLSIRQN